MRSRDHLDAQFLALFLQVTARAAVGIDDEDAFVGRAVPFHRRGDSGGDPVGRVVQDRGEAGQVEVIPAVRLAEREDLARERPASEQQDAAPPGGGKAGARQRAVFGDARLHGSEVDPARTGCKPDQTATRSPSSTMRSRGRW
jgi:hypothetical protein